MTAIIVCLKTGVIACDSRITTGCSIVCDSSMKCTKKNGELYFATGDEDDSDTMLDIILNNGNYKSSPLNANVIHTKNGNVFYSVYENGCIRILKINVSMGFGSGCQLALSALDFGYSARCAIKYAISRDTGCGGKIHCYKIPKWNIKK